MRKLFISIISVVGMFCFLNGMALANQSSVTINSPVDGQEFVVDSLPTSIFVNGTVYHTPGNVNDMRACAVLDDNDPVCGSTQAGVGNSSTFVFTLGLSFDSEGPHAINVYSDKSGGGHYGNKEITIYVYLSAVTCDEKDPPAIANEYLDFLAAPNTWAKIRGQIISSIAAMMNEGKYGTCQYDADLVRADVDDLLELLYAESN